MSDTYLNNQNISNNIIINNPNCIHKEKKSLINRASFESYTSYDGDNNETIDNRINDSFSSAAQEETAQKEEDIDHLRRFHQEKKKIPLPYNQNGKIKNSIKNVPKGINPLTVDKHLNRAISGKIIPLPRKTNVALGNELRSFDNFGYKRSISGDRINYNQPQSRFSSSTENNNNFFHRRTSSNGRDELQNVIINNRKISFNQNMKNPFETAKVTKLKTEIIQNNNFTNKNISQKMIDNYKNNNYHSVNSFNGNSNINLNIASGVHNPVTFINNLQIDNKENIFVNNSNQINLSGNKFHNNIKIVNNSSNNSFQNSSNSPKNLNSNINLLPVSNFELIPGNNLLNYYSNKENINAQNFRNANINIQQRLTNAPINIINSYSINKDMNINQRLTVPHKYINDVEKNKHNSWMIKNEQIYNQQPVQMNQQINLNQTLQQVQLNTPKITIANKIPQLNNNNNYNGVNPANNQYAINHNYRFTVIPKTNYFQQNVPQNALAPRVSQLVNKTNNINNSPILNNITNMNNINNLNNMNYMPNANIINTMNNVNMINIKENKNNNINMGINNGILNQKNYPITMRNPNIILNNNIPIVNNNQLTNNIPINKIINQRNTIANTNILKPDFNQNINKPKIDQIFSQNQIPNSTNTSQSSTIFSQNKVPNTTNTSQSSTIIQSNQRLTQIPRNINQVYIPPQNKNGYPTIENEIINQLNIDDINEKKEENIIKNESQRKEEINNKDINIPINKFDKTGWLKNYGILTLPGKDASGKQKTNQDSFVFKGNINNVKDFNIFGVLDGHGPEGHYVSKFASECITSYLINHPEIKALTDPEQIYLKLKENDCQIITQSFVEADNSLKNVKFDALESGSTCVLVIHIGKHILCANAGDSRAIVVFDEKGDNDLDFYFSEPLSNDYKPEIPEETNRILMSGGVVSQMKNEYGEVIGPYRVWAKGGDYPGLAMSRSIGDLKGKKIGVIPDPGILEYDLSDKTRYIVACSDGVWEFLDNITVREMGKKYYINNNPNGYCRDLVNQSLHLWEENDDVVDDITAVVAFF